jgi:monoterpene epsilon-lactone hydrolase
LSIGISAEVAAAIAAWEAREQRIENPAPDDVAGWDALVEMLNRYVAPANEQTLAQYRPRIETQRVGALSAEVITPVTVSHAAKLVFIHGGGYTTFSARSSLFASVPLAHDLGLETWSIDYPLAPRTRFDTTVPLVVEALAEITSGDVPVVLVGDSAGGGLAVAATLRLCARKAVLPRVIGLWSPWVDVTNQGESHRWLAAADPLLNTRDLDRAALAYAPREEHRNPSVSPLYAAFDASFPPTLVQCGTREILLSDSVRLVRALDAAGCRATLDVWDGLPHSFPAVLPHVPEAVQARARLWRFIEFFL